MAIEKRLVEQDGWNEYSKLVISELERLNENDEKTLLILSDINMKFSRFEAVEKEMESVLKWKRYMEDVASPNTLKDLKSDVIKLNTFKTVATTVWAVVQITFAIFVALNK